MKIIFDSNKPQPPKPATADELARAIVAGLPGHTVAEPFQHSVESHLRLILRTLGYRPKEEEGKPATILELAQQVEAVIALGEAVSERTASDVTQHLIAVHSNVHAAAGFSQRGTGLKDVPLPPKAAVAIALLLAGSLASSQAFESFNATNIIANGTSATYGWASFPTNAVSTNLVITGYTTNGTVITTNGFYPGQQTGRQIETRNYAWTGFKFTGLCTSSNGATLYVWPVRGISPNTPNYVVNTNSVTGNVTNSDWETTPQLSLAIPIPRGTNLVVTWITNLDEAYCKPADYIGLCAITNVTATNCPTDVISNAVFGLEKKVIPLSLTGGNW